MEFSDFMIERFRQKLMEMYEDSCLDSAQQEMTQCENFHLKQEDHEECHDSQKQTGGIMCQQTKPQSETSDIKVNPLYQQIADFAIQHRSPAIIIGNCFDLKNQDKYKKQLQDKKKQLLLNLKQKETQINKSQNNKAKQYKKGQQISQTIIKLLQKMSFKIHQRIQEKKIFEDKKILVLIKRTLSKEYSVEPFSFSDCKYLTNKLLKRFNLDKLKISQLSCMMKQIMEKKYKKQSFLQDNSDLLKREQERKRKNQKQRLRQRQEQRQRQQIKQRRKEKGRLISEKEGKKAEEKGTKIDIFEEIKNQKEALNKKICSVIDQQILTFRENLLKNFGEKSDMSLKNMKATYKKYGLFSQNLGKQ